MAWAMPARRSIPLERVRSFDPARPSIRTRSSWPSSRIVPELGGITLGRVVLPAPLGPATRTPGVDAQIDSSHRLGPPQPAGQTFDLDVHRSSRLGWTVRRSVPVCRTRRVLFLIHESTIAAGAVRGHRSAAGIWAYVPERTGRPSGGSPSAQGMSDRLRRCADQSRTGAISGQLARVIKGQQGARVITASRRSAPMVSGNRTIPKLVVRVPVTRSDEESPGRGHDPQLVL